MIKTDSHSNLNSKATLHSISIPSRMKQESLVDYAQRLSDEYSCDNHVEERKQKGQFFTPASVARFMASLFNINKCTMRLLDPGAGMGILTAAFCEQLMKRKGHIHIIVGAYENDDKIKPYLNNVLSECKIMMARRKHSFDYVIHRDDFILSNSHYIKNHDLFRNDKPIVEYDYVISNPPYFKLTKDSIQAQALSELIHGQPNIYALFMALSAAMLKPNGEMTFITPRSFCSGLYYKKFRQWFVNNVNIKHLHSFESRKEVFDKDDVLQENVIVNAINSRKKSKRITITSSRNKILDNIDKLKIPYAHVVYKKNGDVFIRIPTSVKDGNIFRIINSWPDTFKDLGFEISTGPIVPFRTRKYLLSELDKKRSSTPLIWMHNMQGLKVIWPYIRNGKPSAFVDNYETKCLLLPTKNYVLLRRFSSKEQKHRLHASVLLASELPCKNVAIENHVNYIYKPGGNLSVYEAFGLAALLNTSFFDNYFRSYSGSTQVNASDIKNMPCPGIKKIYSIGRIVYEACDSNVNVDLDQKVLNVMQLDPLDVKNIKNENE